MTLEKYVVHETQDLESMIKELLDLRKEFHFFKEYININQEIVIFKDKDDITCIAPQYNHQITYSKKSGEKIGFGECFLDKDLNRDDKDNLNFRLKDNRIKITLRHEKTVHEYILY